MRAWILALVDTAWALSCFHGDCWTDGWNWNGVISSSGSRPRAR